MISEPPNPGNGLGCWRGTLVERYGQATFDAPVLYRMESDVCRIANHCYRLTCQRYHHELDNGRTRDESSPLGLQTKAFTVAEASLSPPTSTSHFFDPCNFQRLSLSCPPSREIKTIRSLSGQQAEESRRHGEGNRRVESNANALPSIKNTKISVPKLCFELG